ncbi:uncharacterized protein V6R79_007696 [Siganus canaliculatus]
MTRQIKQLAVSRSPATRHQGKCIHKGQAPLKMDGSISNCERKVKQFEQTGQSLVLGKTPVSGRSFDDEKLLVVAAFAAESVTEQVEMKTSSEG